MDKKKIVINWKMLKQEVRDICVSECKCCGQHFCKWCHLLESSISFGKLIDKNED